MGQARTALPCERAEGVSPTCHRFLHDDDGARRTPAKILSAGGPDC